MSVEIETQLEAFMDSIKGGGGGGENPNTVEEISGTLNAIFGLYTSTEISELSASIYNLEATAWLDIDGTALSLGHANGYLYGSVDNHFTFVGFIYDEELTEGSAIRISWGNSGDLTSALYVELSEGTYSPSDMSPYAISLPTVLTVIRHPLPESE